MRAQGTIREWLPFSAAEAGAFLAVLAFVVGTLSLAGVSGEPLALLSVVLLGTGYLAGLLVYARRAATQVRFIQDGALQGAGYIESFRRTRRSLLLMHVDDDAPNEELLGLYRTLLGRGVQIRRTVFLRRSGSTRGYDWIKAFGDHENLKQRVVSPELSEVVRFGFAVVDSSEVLLAVPGHEAVEREPYESDRLLRHLLSVRDPRLAAAFTRLHEEVWQRAEPLRARVRETDACPAARGPHSE